MTSRRVSTAGTVGLFHKERMADFLDKNNAVWVGRAFAAQKGHLLRNPHKVAKNDTDFCKARLHCKFDPCVTCAPCDDGLHLHTRDESLDLYRAHLTEHPDLIDMAAELVEERWSLACRCPMDQPCHVDVLIELADLAINDMWEAA
ncbi:DUF4326 domain-containing protein [Streptomyces sp. NPDC050535]|uniref:DUF4326 domain-containing protein n=1 Tax=Streptomyces sp. NPDC050535 TaxID=3365626 RepID=UPI00379D85D3